MRDASTPTSTVQDAPRASDSPARPAGTHDVGEVPRVLHVVPGPRRHGVTGHALALLAQPPAAHHSAYRIATGDDAVVDDANARAAEATTPADDANVAAGGAKATAGLGALPPAVLTHLHLTDRLLAANAPACADLVVPVARGRALSLALHDLPQPGEGAGRYERRRGAYARMAAAAVGVIVASHHEADLLRDALAAEGLAAGGPVEVVPLPLAAAPLPAEELADLTDQPDAPCLPDGRDLAVFGFVYPGKGHAEAIEAAAGLDADVGVVALGAVADGHEGLVDDYVATARGFGRRFTATGYLGDDEALVALRAAAVPVAPHRHVSASGSIGAWLAAGRRPLVPAGRYTEELEARCPGSLLLYGPGRRWPDLRAAAAAALADPSLTRLGLDVRLTPSPAEAAARTVEVLDAWADEAARAASSPDPSGQCPEPGDV